MLITTWALLYSLHLGQRQHCQFAMDAPGRLDWDFIPVQGGQFLIEFDNAIDNGNHVHSVWRGHLATPTRHAILHLVLGFGE